MMLPPLEILFALLGAIFAAPHMSKDFALGWARIFLAAAAGLLLFRLIWGE